MKKKIVIINQKGGVGKTTTSVNLVGAFAEQGLRVLAIDVDSQGDLSSVFLDDHEALPFSIADLFSDSGVSIDALIQPTKYSNVFIITADRRLNIVDKTHDFLSDPNVLALADAIRTIEQQFDVIVMDCAPRSHLSAFAALAAADHVLVPVEVENFAVRSIATIEEDYREVKQAFNPRLSIHYFLSKVSSNSKTQEKSRQILTAALGQANVFRVAIPMMATYKSAINTRKPITVAKGKTKAADIVRAFAKELSGLPHERSQQAAA